MVDQIKEIITKYHSKQFMEDDDMISDVKEFNLSQIKYKDEYAEYTCTKAIKQSSQVYNDMIGRPHYEYELLFTSFNPFRKTRIELNNDTIKSLYIVPNKFII